jgi:hypothetical protein
MVSTIANGLTPLDVFRAARRKAYFAALRAGMGPAMDKHAPGFALWLYQPTFLEKLRQYDWVTLFCVSFFLCSVTSYTIAVVLLARRDATRAGSWYRSKYLDRTNRAYRRPADIRGQFDSMPLPVIRATPGHSHGFSAAARSVVYPFARALAAACGRRVVMQAMRPADKRNGAVGDHTWNKHKDAGTTVSRVEPGPRDLRVMIDCDYDTDMPQFLLTNTGEVLLYTFEPSKAGEAQGEYTYCFDRNSVAHVDVAGGGHYTHALWDYGPDCVVVSNVTSWTAWLMPWRATTASYLTNRKRVSGDHNVILLTPLGRWTGAAAHVAAYLPGTPLRRRDINEGEFTRMRVVTQGGLKNSIARTMSTMCVTVPSNLIDLGVSLRRVVGKAIQPATYARHLRTAGVTDAEAVVLTDYANSTEGVPQPTPSSVVCPSESATRFQFRPATYDQTAKPAMNAFMSPLMAGACVPDLARGNDEQGVKGRITDLARSTPVTSYIYKAMVEFVELLVPDELVGTMRPADDSEVEARQNRPTQQAIYREGGLLGWFKRVFDTFMKREAASKYNDPRIITTGNAKDKRDYSRFIYPFADYLKTFDWYAFGKAPIDIARRVADIASRAVKLIAGDASRMDGRVNEAPRLLERMIMFRLFDPQYHAELDDLMRAQHSLKAETKFGVRYNHTLGRASGSAETSAFNTTLAKFMDYLTRREADHSLTAAQAFAGECIVGGDDSLMADVEEEAFKTAAARVGQLATSDVYQRGDNGVNFLARIYGPGVWHGDENSCCDLPRQLQKFHLTVTCAPGDELKKLAQKCVSFYLTDRNTPILGAFVTRYMQLSDTDADTFLLNEDASWTARLATSPNQYPNEDQGWMDAYARSSMPGVDVAALETFLAEARTPDDLLRPPCVYAPPPPPPPPADVVADGEVVRAPTKPSPEKPKPQPKRKGAARRIAAKG